MFGLITKVASSGMLGSMKMYIYLAIAAAVVAACLYVYGVFTEQKLEISNLNTTISKLDSKLNTKKLEVMNRDNIIEALDNSVTNIMRDINISNAKVEASNKALSAAKDELNAWMAKPPVSRYEKVYEKIDIKNTDYSKEDCKAGLQLNKYISEINYEDL